MMFFLNYDYSLAVEIPLAAKTSNEKTENVLEIIKSRGTRVLPVAPCGDWEHKRLVSRREFQLIMSEPVVTDTQQRAALV